MKKRVKASDMSLNKIASQPLNVNSVHDMSGMVKVGETAYSVCDCGNTNMCNTKAPMCHTVEYDCHTMLYTNCDCNETERAGMSCVACETGQGCQSGYCPHTVSQQMICCALTEDDNMCVIQTRGVTCIQPVTNPCNTDGCPVLSDNGCPVLSDNPPCVYTEMCAQTDANTDCGR